ncbi:pyridoxamine 5'-phosphate oxidase family protein [Streptomyces thermospinosisporus]|uniref:Pyridoxamine 5'-phosphate oxidase family protein n=1 Tax=Streptomyces thermospinosisporus TaxID=161482 RepID=A0ABP4JK35_9ACTN
MNVNWEAFVTAEPDFARTVEERFRAYTHHVLATLRKDGSPRTTGLEVRFFDGELWFGMMPDSRKALDLRRDPRFALQANPGEGTTMGGGDVRISGRAFEVEDEEIRRKYNEGEKRETSGNTEKAAEAAAAEEEEKADKAEPPEPFHLFRTELTEVVRTYVEDEKYLVMQVWKPGEPVRTLKRT